MSVETATSFADIAASLAHLAKETGARRLDTLEYREAGVIGVAIDPKVVDPDDVETLQDLIVGAVADASKQVTILAQTRLGPLAGGLGGLGIPGV